MLFIKTYLASFLCLVSLVSASTFTARDDGDDDGRYPVPSFPEQFLVDPRNGTEAGRILDNGTRVVLRMDFSHFAQDKPWYGVQARLIYDLSIADPPLDGGRGPSHLVWTAPVRYFNIPHIPFWHPGREIGWTPFTDSLLLFTDQDASLDWYLDHSDELATSWIDNAGLISDTSLNNTEGWNITRVLYVDGLVYMKEPGPSPPEVNVSVAAIYLMETEARPFEIVWWEMVPFTWAMGWEDPYGNSSWFWNADVPQGLRDKLLAGNHSSPPPRDIICGNMVDGFEIVIGCSSCWEGGPDCPCGPFRLSTWVVLALSALGLFCLFRLTRFWRSARSRDVILGYDNIAGRIRLT